MPNPTEPHAPRAALLILTAGLLLPGALAGQLTNSASIPSTVSVPPLEQVGSGSLGGPHPSRPVPPEPASTVVPTLRPAALAAGEDRDRTPRFGAAGGLGSPQAAPASLPSGVFLPVGGRQPAGDDVREPFGSLGEFLPRELRRDLLELRARIQRYRTVLFGTRGIVRWGEMDGSEGTSRLRLNLQADPDPGFRVTLVTR